MDAAPVIARGHNLAALVPPVPAAAAPYLQAIPDQRPTLILTADGDRAAALARALPDRASIAVTGLARAQRRLAAGGPALLFTSTPDALRLLKRSALGAAAFQTVVLAWPEQLDEEGREALESVMAETSRDAQRMILTASGGADVEVLIERYAMKAVTFGFPPAEAPQASAPTLGPASFVVARTAQLDGMRVRILDALDPEQDEDVRVEPCPASREAAEALARSAGGRKPAPRLVFVLEPFQIAWVRSLFSPLTPLRVPVALDALEQRAEAVRARLERTLDSENLDRELFLIGPLLDCFDPAEVAAAALRLAAASGLTQSGSGPSLAVHAASASGSADADAPPAWAKLWVGVGRKDNVRPGDVLGAIVGETKLPADHVGRIDVRELFCLVEVRAEEADLVVRALTGTTLRGRRITARVDRGHGPPKLHRGSRPPRPPER